jgi:hypothetical protein
MWQIKTFKTREKQIEWIVKNFNKYQIEEIFIENGYAVEFKKLRQI